MITRRAETSSAAGVLTFDVAALPATPPPVPLIELSGNLAAAGLLYHGERTGKAIRTPARDTMLAHASADVGRGLTWRPRLGCPGPTAQSSPRPDRLGT